MLGSRGRFSFTAMAVALLTAGYSGAADADTIRLGGAGQADDASTQNLLQRVGDDGDVIQTRARGGFAVGYRGGGGGRGFVAGGFRAGGGYRGGFVAGGYRGGYWGGYRGGVRVGVGVGGYRGGYWGGYGYRGYYGGVRIGGWGYRPWGYGGYYYGGYAAPYYAYSYPCYYGVTDTVEAVTMQVPLSARQGGIPYIEDGSTLPNPQPNVVPQQNGPFRYDGGPADPVPMPMTKPAPAVKGTTSDRFVSMPAPTSMKKYTYAAYGEKHGGEKTIVMPGDDPKAMLVRADAK